jgi:hypothetical protein
MTIFVWVLASGLAAAQSPSVVQNTRATMNAVHDNSAAASNAALGAPEKTSPATRATHAPADAGVSVKPAVAGSNKTKATASRVSALKPVKSATAHKSAHAKAEPTEAKKKTLAEATVAGTPAGSEAGNKAATDEQAAPENRWTGKRDPFISPVVSRAATNSNCSTGKKCLEIGTINLRGVVHAENGFIAVVSNSMNKAYFLRENDPVFNGYVVRITGDSIVFQETLQDRLGKTFTREVVKKITIPAV